MTQVLPPIWPGVLPLVPLARDLAGGPRDTRLTFEAESAPISRPRITVDVDVYRVTLRALDDDEFAAFKSFVRDDLARGSTRFAWVHPVTREIRPAQIAPSQGELYSVNSRPPRWSVSFAVMIFDYTPWFAQHLSIVNGFLQIVSHPV